MRMFSKVQKLTKKNTYPLKTLKSFILSILLYVKSGIKIIWKKMTGSVKIILVR